MMVEVSSDQRAWDAYVSAAVPDRLYHRWDWLEVIEQTFGHKSFRLVAVQNGTIRGVLPLTSMRSRLFGNFLVSIPFFTYGGVIAATEESRNALLCSAVQLAKNIGANHIELRQGDCPTGWRQTTSKVTMEIPLPTTVEEYLTQLSSSRRKRIRYCLKSGLHAEWSGREGLPAFYKLFALNMRNLGTPVYPLRFFENQICRFRERIRILTLWDQNEAVAAGFVTSHGTTLELPWAASLSDYQKKDLSLVMYWRLIEKAITEGYHGLDLGRCSRGSGSWEFKRHWNPIERPLHWYYWLNAGASIPEFRADNPKFKIATGLWKRLPLAVANGLGPHIVRSIP
jgi:FemAB-related protein (PEP-CTERM system-associated)